MSFRSAAPILALLSLATAVAAADGPADTTPTRRGNELLARYFQAKTAAISQKSLADVQSLAEWTSRREEARRQLFEMLGLWPMPQRTELNATVTGKIEHPDMTVEKIEFQSRPGLYVTGNLYLPKDTSKPLPTILYVCGHGNVKKGDVSYGSKVFYQHHGAWLARNGYVCFIIDTLELGEIEGEHHGTFRKGMWWWNSRGYTPAGVEAWNAIRALDYLETRSEVDKDKIGITGRSGGGAYSWYTAALDERIKVAVPVAGITDLQNHVVDGTIEGHCDCMFPVNSYRWDFPQVAALVAPRPLLIGNTDKDTIFPLDGVMRVHAKVKKIYQLYGATDKLGIALTEGPHKDTQELQVAALRWFNRFLKGTDPLIENAAKPLFTPEDLKVFTSLPDDQLNTRIHETFVPAADEAPVPLTTSRWTGLRAGWLKALQEKSFGGWPSAPGDLAVRKLFSADRQGMQLTGYEFMSEEHVPLRVYLLQRAGLQHPDHVVMNVLDAEGWSRWAASLRPAFQEELSHEVDGGVASLPAPDEKGFAARQSIAKGFDSVWAYVTPRGVGYTAWEANETKQVQIRRRFMLLGETLDGMRVWDVRRGLQAVRSLKPYDTTPIWLQGQREMSVVALYASLFEPPVSRLDLWDLPTTHRDGPDFLNVLRIWDVPQAVTVAAEHSIVHLYQKDKSGWDYPQQVISKLGWDANQMQIRPASEPGMGN